MTKTSVINKTRIDFIKKMIQHCLNIKKIRPREIYIFNVIANHGSYQIIIGPEYSSEECRKLHTKPHTRKIEIKGTMHHLFINPKKISPTPEHEDVKANLKGSVIMKDIAIHIVDQNSKETSIDIAVLNRNMMKVRQKINLAGNKGDELVDKLTSSGRLVTETYKIVQEDILKAIK